ncbi:MAG: hypothetical protein QHH07_11490, partial [Sedimentisphaerales bacterium]|nr:hypothetical protein [Sedimentisphaerales bacterium]
THAFDAHGDRGLELQILDAEKATVLRQFLTDRGTVWVECPVVSDATYTIRLNDQDTSLDKPNSGRITARLRIKAPDRVQ